MIVIGTDEAGYGPNLGPLVISATAWSVPKESIFSKLVRDLAAKKIRIDDSKKIYRGGDTLLALEEVVLPALQLFRIWPDQYVLTTCELPLEGPNGFPGPPMMFGKVRKLVDNQIALKETLDRLDIKLLALRSRSIFPAEFNWLLELHDSKGSLLSTATLRLVMELLAGSVAKTNEPVLVLCDKHGGRNRYLDLLTNNFPGEFFQVVTEGREKSVYRTVNSNRPIEFRFLAKGDSETPVALASMVSKYLRELAMIRFNEFWRSRIPDLASTAGYPVDARRFKNEIDAVQRELEIDDDMIWRRR